MHIRFLITATIVIGVFAGPTYSQGCGNLQLEEVGNISGMCSKMTLCARPDALGRPYLYIASKEAGLIIHTTENGLPTFTVALGPEYFDSLDVMNISQQGNYLYLALGNHFGNATQTPGLAIIDVTQAMSPKVTAIYKYPASNGGCGIVKAEGDYAYMGAMLHGLIILDISDKYTIKYVSEIVPDRNFPAPKPDTLKYNARGMAVRNGIVYLCFDAGGVRVINTTDKAHPVETGRYSAPEVLNRPRAYNNLVLDDTLLYVACDYCGMEVLSIADTSHIKRIGWWNPWQCEGPANNWFNSTGYANEIEYLPSCKLAFISAGRTPLEVVNLSDPSHPDSCSGYPAPINVGSWGISIGADHLYLSYICAIIPFVSASTGLKILSYTPCTSDVTRSVATENITLSPQPASRTLRILTADAFTNLSNVAVKTYDELGATVAAPYHITGTTELTLDLSQLACGTYYIRLCDGRSTITKKCVKE
jgi:hypothetical protein